MRNMKKIIAWMLGLIMLLGLGAAAGESALPEIPEFQGTLDTRPIASEEEAIAYAKEILALDFIGVDAAGTDYNVDAERGRLQILADGAIAAGDVQVDYETAACTWTGIRSGASGELRGSLRVVSDNATGENR